MTSMDSITKYVPKRNSIKQKRTTNESDILKDYKDSTNAMNAMSRKIEKEKAIE